MADTAATKVRGIIRIGFSRGGSWAPALVSRDEIVLDASLQRIHLPRTMDGLDLSSTSLSAAVPDWGVVQFTPWRNRRWRSALAQHGWIDSDAGTDGGGTSR